MATLAAVKASSLIDNAWARRTTSATVGVDSTLSPEGINPQGVAKWVNRAVTTTNPLAVALGYQALTLSVRPPTKASRLTKVTVKLVLPTLEQTSASTATGIQPAPTKAYDCTFVGEFMLPERSTQLERQTLFSMTQSLFMRLINASDDVPTDVTGMPLEVAVVSLENVY
jgi:hypothetical protein